MLGMEIFLVIVCEHHHDIDETIIPFFAWLIKAVSRGHHMSRVNQCSGAEENGYSTHLGHDVMQRHNPGVFVQTGKLSPRYVKCWSLIFLAAVTFFLSISSLEMVMMMMMVVVMDLR